MDGKPLPQGAAGSPGRPASEVEDEGRALIGQTIGGKYFVRSVLGRGGMGTVYEGVNVQMGRVVALKVLHPKQVKKRESVKRFYQEARAAGAIGHPNICEVYDLGSLEDGCPYLVIERLVGSTLAQHARQSVLPFDAAIDIMVQVLSGLVAAHEKGIVHRDLKPDNIFLSERVGCPPVAKVLDFRRLEGRLERSRGASRRRPRPHTHRHGHGDAVLHVSRTGERGAGSRRAGRPLRLRRHPLRDAHGEAPVPRGQLPHTPVEHPQDGAAAPRRAAARPPPAARDRDRAGNGARPRCTLRDRAGVHHGALGRPRGPLEVRNHGSLETPARAVRSAASRSAAARASPPAPRGSRAGRARGPRAAAAGRGPTCGPSAAPRSAPGVRGRRDRIDGLKDFSFAVDESEAATTLIKGIRA